MLQSISETSSSVIPLSVRDAIAQHVNNTTTVSEALENIRESAHKCEVAVSGTMTGAASASLMALTSARRDGHPAAAIASPAVGVVGLHLVAGFGDDGVLTCINPELEHQSLTKSALRAAGIRPNRQRLLPLQSLGVVDRLAVDSYDSVYLDVASAILRAVRKKAWSLLRSGGVLVLTGALLDGTIADSSCTDRDTAAACEADECMLQLDDAFVMRLPLVADITVLVGK